MNCPLCNSSRLQRLYEVKEIPAFQNKVYRTIQQAKNVTLANVTLSQCDSCNFVFNSDFDPTIMNYDPDYQNEQSYSPYFKSHLETVLNFIKKRISRKKKIIEIGCGQGAFLQKLSDAGFEAIGFDPTYDGANPNIIKEYFTEKHSELNTELICLRHVLEHIHNPLDFLHNIARAVNYSSMIYIEIPGLDWLLNKRAYWDIYHEHCNYFTIETLGALFKDAEIGYIFGGQYIYLMANLKDLKDQAAYNNSKPSTLSIRFSELNKKLVSHQSFIQSNNALIVWGAGAKGSTFVNLMDPENRHIDSIVDLNPKKQNRYIAKSAHSILSNDDLPAKQDQKIIVMNDNYIDEIRKTISHDVTLYSLGDL